MTTKLTRHYRIRLTCTVNMTDPISILMSAFNANAIDSRGVTGTIGDIFSFHPTTVVSTLRLHQPVCHRLTTCKRINHRSLSII